MELCILPSRAESLGGVRTTARATAHVVLLQDSWDKLRGEDRALGSSELPCVSGRPRVRAQCVLASCRVSCAHENRMSRAL